MKNLNSKANRHVNRALFLAWTAAVAAGVWQAQAIKDAVNAPYAARALERQMAQAAAARKRRLAAAAALRHRQLAVTARALEVHKILARATTSWRRTNLRKTPGAWFEKHFEMSRNVMMEAGIEPFRGKLAVACITMNRVRSKRYPDTVKGVIWQQAQFSWTFLPKYRAYRGVNARQEILKTGKKFPGWRQAWADSKKAAAQVLTGAYDCARFAGIYHYMNPDYTALRHRRQWRRGMEPAFRIGRHVFWKRRATPDRHAANSRRER